MKKEKYRLGLDLGTASIGWSVLKLDDENEVSALLDMGVRIFPDGREASKNGKVGDSLAVARRKARSTRKIIYRRKLRRKETFRLLQNQGLFPKDKEKCMALKALNPYLLRIKALDEKLSPYELGRALFNLSVRRGFKSNRKDMKESDDSKTKSEAKKEAKAQKDKQNALEEAIKESGARTLAEFLYKSRESNKGLRFVEGRMPYYPTRKMYEDEFNLIRSAQEKYFGDVNWDAIYNVIFFQRSLKPQERGLCRYMPDKKRTFKALPSSQRLRILQDIRNLAYYDSGRKKKELDGEEDKKLYDLFNSKDKVTFDQMRKTLKLDKGCSFNLEENRSFLKGNETEVKMRSKNRFGKLWDELSLEEKDEIAEKIITADADEEVYKALQNYKLSDEQKDFIVKTVFPTGTAMLCKEVTEKLVARMEEISLLKYHEAVESLGYKYAEQDVEKCDTLPYYGAVLTGSVMGGSFREDEVNAEKRYGKIANPTVHIALNQTRVVVNALIKQYGKPAQIAIELSRELKNSVEKRKEIASTQRKRAKENETINASIKDAYEKASAGSTFYPNRNDRLKWRLWQELGKETMTRKCLYCGRVISGSELFTKEIEIEHILPFSRTLLNAESNLTVAHSSCNAFKKERSPYEAFHTNPNGFNWSEIVSRANCLKNTAKKNRFSPNAMENFERDSSFIARQLTDNQYIARAALRYLKCLVENPADVWATNGGMTKLLRDKWEMDSILSRKFTKKEAAILGLDSKQIGTYKKNRYDHRHHAVDAVVIALTDRSMVQSLATQNAHKGNRIEIPEFPLPRRELEEKVRNIVVSFKPDHGAEGKLSKDTLLGKIKIDGKETYVCRASLTFRRKRISLSEKNLDDIVDAKIRNDVKEFVNSRKEKKLKEALQEFSEKTGIKKVRIKNHGQTPIAITSGKVPRYYEPIDYFAALVWEIPGEKTTYKAQYIRRTEVEKDEHNRWVVKRKVKEAGKPHPAAQELCLLHKNDYLEFFEGGKSYLCRVAGYKANDQAIDIRPIYAATDCKDWVYSTNEKMIETSSCWIKEKNGEKKPQDGQNHFAVNTLFGKLKARAVTVNPIGRVFRK